MIWDPARNVEACHDHGGWPWVFLQCVDLMSNFFKKKKSKMNEKKRK